MFCGVFLFQWEKQHRTGYFSKGQVKNRKTTKLPPPRNKNQSLFLFFTYCTHANKTQISAGDLSCGMLRNAYPTHKDFVHMNMQMLPMGKTRQGSASLSQDMKTVGEMFLCKDENAHPFFIGDRDTREISCQSLHAAGRISSCCLRKDTSE